MGTPLRVLLVEDSEDDALLVVAELKRGSYEARFLRVESAQSMREALRSEKWEIVLSDYSMPGFSGMAAFELLRERDPITPFILISGMLGEEIAVAAMRSGVQDYLLKGNLGRLVPAVQRELADAETRRARKRAEEALRQSEERFRLIAENIDSVFWIYDLETRRLSYVSPAYERIWGRPSIAGEKSWAMLLEPVHPEDRSRVSDAIALNSPQGFDIVFRIVHPDGALRWIRNRNFPVLDSSGRIAQFVGIAEDFTSLKRAEQALENEQRFLLAMLDTLSDGIVACDAAGVVTLVNRATRELYGLPVDIPVSESWDVAFELFDVNGQSPLAPSDRPLARALRDEVVKDAEIVIVPKIGTRRTVLASGRPIRDERGSKLGAVMAIHDVTERNSLEQQFRQAQKMEAFGQLAGGVAHDFNNLLTTILGYSDLLLASNQADEIREDIEQIHRAGERAADLTAQLLAFSRNQVAEPRMLDLNLLVGEMEKMLGRIIGGGIELRTFLDPAIGSVNADPGRIEQVLLNLVINAKDAMPEGGRLTIETSRVELDASYARQHMGVVPGRYIRLSVSDTGVGVPSEIVPRIFEPFFTTKNQGKGTGLGLSTVYGIVKQGRGHVWVDSEPGNGSVFSVYLPEVEARASQIEPLNRDEKPKAGTGTIFLVEDDDSIRSLAHRVLVEAGYTVIEAGSGEDALSMFVSLGPIDMVVTDTALPGLNGVKLAQELRTLQPDLRILFTSGFTDADFSVVTEPTERPTHFLQKPFSPELLLRCVHQVLDG
jgi:two-component system, cell cycle sensor histidine kinase and response regulator CckA